MRVGLRGPKYALWWMHLKTSVLAPVMEASEADMAG
jgi:hypothetical protein